MNSEKKNELELTLFAVPVREVAFVRGKAYVWARDKKEAFEYTDTRMRYQSPYERDLEVVDWECTNPDGSASVFCDGDSHAEDLEDPEEVDPDEVGIELTPDLPDEEDYLSFLGETERLLRTRGFTYYER
jgi:hypothetical protein